MGKCTVSTDGKHDVNNVQEVNQNLRRAGINRKRD